MKQLVIKPWDGFCGPLEVRTHPLPPPDSDCVMQDVKLHLLNLQRFRVLRAWFSRFRGLRFRVLSAWFSRFRGLRFRVLGASFSRFWGLRFRDRVLRFRSTGPRFRVLGASFSRFGCFVFEFWVLRASVFVFECFVFETTSDHDNYFV